MHQRIATLSKDEQGKLSLSEIAQIHDELHPQRWERPKEASADKQ